MYFTSALDVVSDLIKSSQVDLAEANDSISIHCDVRKAYDVMIWQVIFSLGQTSLLLK